MVDDPGRPSGLKAKLAAKDLVIGSWIQLAYAQTTEICARAGFGFMVVDMEHTSIAAHELLSAIQIGQLAGQQVLVRVGANDPLLVKRAMDAGADGIIMPMTETADDILRARDAMYYPPRGKRGVGLARGQDFGLGFDAYRDRMDTSLVLIAQVEHWRGVENIEKILDVDGVDGMFVGPYDLSASYGKPGRFDDPEVAAALSRVAEVVKAHPKPSGIHVVQPDAATLRRRVEEGYRFLCYGTDMVLFAEMVRRTLADVADLLPARSAAR